MKWLTAMGVIIGGASVIVLVDVTNIDCFLSLLFRDQSYDLPLWQVLSAFGTISAICTALLIPSFEKNDKSTSLRKSITNLLVSELKLNQQTLELIAGSIMFKIDGMNLRTSAVKQLLKHQELFDSNLISKVTRLYELLSWYNDIIKPGTKRPDLTQYGQGREYLSWFNEMEDIMKDLIS